MNTIASNPTGITFDQNQWYRFHKKGSLIITGCMLIALFLSFKFSYYFLFLFGFIVIVNKIYWWFIGRRFLHGDYNVGKIVSTSPMLLAVPTNLSKGHTKSFPVIKIIEIKFDKLGDHILMIGDKLGTAGLYSHSKDDSTPFWEGFSPEPVYYANSDYQSQAERANNSVSAEKWAELENNLKQLPQPFQVGIYKINDSASNWAEFPEANLK